MNTNTRLALTVVGGAASFVVFFEILWNIVPLIGIVVTSMEWLLSTILQILIFLVMAVLTIAAPCLAGLVCLMVGLWFMAKIQRQLTNLQKNMSAQAKETAIDGTALAVFGLLSALVFYMATADFMENFTIVRFMAFAAAICTICKMLILVPAKPIKIIGLLGTTIISITVIALIIDHYNFISSYADLRFGHLLENSSKEKGSPTARLFTLGATGMLFITTALYPFTIKGWRRVWRA